MRNDKWVFFQVPSKPSLSIDEVKYWKSNLSKILKSGLEFEFNLPNKKGSCKGTSNHCPCVKMTKDEFNCWKDCLREEECKELLGDEFNKSCAGTACTGFIMKCAACDDFELNCEACQHRYDPESDPDNIRARLKEQFNPSKNYGSINETGVHDIVCDGSLLGGKGDDKGVEIITTGRRVDYWEFFKMNNKIIQEAVAKGAYMNERCSIHVHLLASYYGNSGGGMGHKLNETSELERPLPQLVMANFHQLCRKYQNAITWMSAGLDDYEHFTRWEKFRKSILNVSPVNNSMESVINIMEEKSGKKRGKYGWVNYMFTQFNGNQDITKFHLEMRSLDGILSASAVTAMTCLFYAMIIKAVEISNYGLLEVGSEEWMDKTVSIKKKLMNGSGSYGGDRTSYTGDLSTADFSTLVSESMELNDQLKHILLKLGPVYEVIEKIAKEPPAMKRCAGKSWKDIESDYAVYIPKETKLEKLLNSYIDMRTHVRCTDEREWRLHVFEDISREEGEDVSEALSAIVLANKSDGEFMWSDNLGTMLKV